jgi:glycosyltransferase involved in cell wall biosynthesis
LLVMARPKLLFVSPRFLFPNDEGGKIRTANILRHMKGGEFEVTLAAPAPAKLALFAVALDALCDHFVCWPQRPASQLRRLCALFERQPVSVASGWSKAGRASVARALAKHPEVVVVDFPHASILLPDHPVSSTSLLFTHNVEAEIFERHATLARGLRQLVWRDQSRKMRRFEARALKRFDAIIAVSGRDALALRRRYHVQMVEAIDTGVDLDFFRFSLPTAGPQFDSLGGIIVFVGVMDSPANSDGVTFLMHEVWPIVARVRPQARAIIVGRNPPKALVALAHDRNLNWHFTGFVDDVRPLVASSHVSVIPLRVGSGTRIKAFEAMAMGRPVVSTPIGVEGLAIEAGRHYLAAESAEDFAAAILRLLADPGLCDRIARAARERLEERFSWAQVARQFETICQRAIARKMGSVAMDAP